MKIVFSGETGRQIKSPDKAQGRVTYQADGVPYQRGDYLERLSVKTPFAGSSKLSSVMDQIALGQKLGSSDLRTSRLGSPLEYQKQLFMKEEREYYKKMLRQCTSKEEVKKLREEKLSQFMMELDGIDRSGMDAGAKDQAREYIRQRMEGIEEEHKTFTKSMEYKRLPKKAKEDDAKKLMRQALRGQNASSPPPASPQKKDRVEEAVADIALRRETGQLAPEPSAVPAPSEPAPAVKPAAKAASPQKGAAVDVKV